MLALEEGQLRCANLRLLVQYAGQYEKNGYKGLWGFVRYLDRPVSGSDLAPAAVNGAGDGAVKVMSIHRPRDWNFLWSFWRTPPGASTARTPLPRRCSTPGWDFPASAGT